MTGFSCKYYTATFFLVNLLFPSAAVDATAEVVDLQVKVDGDENVTCFNKEFWGDFDDVRLVVHHNGQGAPCGEIGRSHLVNAFQETFQDAKQCPSMKVIPTTEANDENSINYEMESTLTRMIHRTVHTCRHSDSDATTSNSGRSSRYGFYGYCDMGKAKTPVLKDHSRLVPNYVYYKSQSQNNNKPPRPFLPCHFHTKVGLRISSFAHLAELARESIGTGGDGELHLYAVPAGRYFMFAPSFAGEVIELNHIPGGDAEQSVSLRVLSVQPRVFDFMNFFHPINEGDVLLEQALQETRDELKLSRSVVEDEQIIGTRTSDTGWDISSTVAQALKRRCFDVLGFGSGISNISDSGYEYFESHAEGLQTLRYNLTTACTPHLDYFDVRGRPSFNSEGRGSNRFATIILYLSDLEPHNGGETVFVAAAPMGQTRQEQVDLATAIRQLRASGMANALQPGSWEEELAAKCRIRLTVRPRRGRAILFYSQLPDGQYDPYSNHGACPVLQGEKYAANLWIWNGPRANK